MWTRLGAALLFGAIAAPALADDTTGEVLAFDRVANRLVLADKTVWQIPKDFAMPEELVAGERVKIAYVSAGDTGVGRLVSITRAD